MFLNIVSILHIKDVIHDPISKYSADKCNVVSYPYFFYSLSQPGNKVSGEVSNYSVISFTSFVVTFVNRRGNIGVNIDNQ